MGLNNVAMIIAPNLFFQNNAIINISEAKKAAGMTDVLRMLIKYQAILWTVCFEFFCFHQQILTTVFSQINGRSKKWTPSMNELYQSKSISL